MYQRRLLSRYLTSGNKEFTITVMAIATVIIPVHPSHEHLVSAAIASVQAQTIPVEINVYLDKYERGAGYARNAAAENVTTPFLTFLDADDTLEPTFIERYLQAYEKGRYVYGAWFEGERVMRPRPCNPFLAHDFGDGRGIIGGYHHVTTLIPTAIFKELGGFDVDLPGMEDTDFFMRVHRNHICGVYVDEPLFRYNYSGENSRGHVFKKHPDYDDIVRSIYERNGGILSMANCGKCGGSEAPAIQTSGRQPGDVPAETLYAPMSQVGRATGRWYDRKDHQFMGQVVYVDPRDVQAMPDLFRRVHLMEDLTPTREDVLKESGLI
jgi:hypothetical protein